MSSSQPSWWSKTASDLARVTATSALRLPAPLVSLLAGGTRWVVLDGQRLDLQVQAVLESHRWLGLPALEDLPVDEARAAFEQQVALLDAARAPMARVEGFQIPGPAGPIPCRLYVPHGAREPGPALVYYHGGGFVVGSLDSHDRFCRVLADRSGVRILAVDYRLAPEHRFPAAADDATAVWRWVVEDPHRIGAAPGRLAVGGDSAGGNLSAVVTIDARAARAPEPTFALLIYPALDLTRQSVSHRTFAEGFLLTGRLMDWFLDRYVPDPSDRRHPRASPAFVEDLRGLPPSHVVTAGFDPLRDEGRLFADRLRDAGVPVRYDDHPGLVHGFVSMTGGVAAARRAVDEMAAILREAVR